MTLTPADLEVLEFGRHTWDSVGRRDSVILERFGHSVTRFYQRLNHLLDTHDAVIYDAQLVNRLNRIRARQRAHRERPAL